MSLLLRTLCKIPRDLAASYKSSHKTILLSPVRWNTAAANAFKAHRAHARKEKEPSEVFKWILLAIPVTSFGLGCWQVYRLQWKITLIDMLHSKSNATAVDMPSDFSELEKMEYKPVKVRGKFIHEKEILIGPRAMIDETSGMARPSSLVSDPKKNQGWLVVTPFMLEDTGDVILVNRGWVHHSMKSKEKREASYTNKEVELVGVVRLTEKRSPFMPKNHPEKGSWFYRDLEQMSSHLGCQPIWLDARGIPDPPEGWPIPNQTRVTIRNEHLSYIITWYSLSFFTALMWHRYFIKKLPLL